MHAALKLLTGLAATVVLAAGAGRFSVGPALTAQAAAIGALMEAHGIEDGSVSFRQPSRRFARIARLSGTADPATRAAVLAEVKRRPAIADALWVPR
jgi:hypothetical protein